MRKQIEQLKEWNQACGINTPPHFIALHKDRMRLRYDLLDEENSEYILADNHVELADALGDMLYVLVGTIVEHGLADKIEDIFDEIHRSNMTKVVAGRVKKRDDGKILKPQSYEKPNLEKILLQ
jgi:predicted HAD superfamily Cof-like phosphohydrolase